VFWVGLFAVVYLTLLRPAASNEFLRQFFAPAFLPLDAPRLPARVFDAAWRLVHPAIYLPRIPAPLRALVLAVAVAGLAAVARARGGAGLALLGLPIVTAFAAATVEQYPIAQRTMLFAAPLLVVLLIAGGRALAGRLPTALARPALALGAVALTLPPAGAAVRDAVRPWHGFDARRAVRDLERRNVAGEPVYVTYYARPGYAFYTTDWSRPDTARLNWWDLARSPRAPGDSLLPDDADGADAFARRYRGRVELAQRLPPGLFRTFLSDSALPNRPADSVWAQPDAERIRAQAHPYAWILFGGWQGKGALIKAIQRIGGDTVYSYSAATDMYLYRVRFR
jgi:hypothetical protein